jgi:uncharacterized protein YgbK (DUF1537 family)
MSAARDQTVSREELLATLPPPWPRDLLDEIRAAVASSGARVVVLDDDPTGTQTVHGVPVLTRWQTELLADELAAPHQALYLLTNSRALPPSEAEALNATIGRNLADAARRAGVRLAVVSRSDSTLRGHFPGEVAALAGALGYGDAPWLLAPFFEEGGRYTVGDVHYVADGDLLVPAGATEFARDATFGYHASNLRAWVEEKTGGRVRADDVESLSIEEIRAGGPARVAERLLALAPGAVCVVNAAARRDLEVVALGALEAEARGRRFLYRTAASFVALRAGIAPRPPLAADEMGLPDAGGALVVVGSYVPRSSRQLAELLALPRVTPVELEVGALLDDARREGAIGGAAREVEAALLRGEDAVLHTSRALITGVDGASSLAIGARVSAGLVETVRAVGARPRYLIAKGGITSSDIATEALGARRALVLGQALAGVPVWQLGAESRWPGMAYVVFPGNVGGPGALADLVLRLREG